MACLIQPRAYSDNSKVVIGSLSDTAPAQATKGRGAAAPSGVARDLRLRSIASPHRDWAFVPHRSVVGDRALFAGAQGIELVPSKNRAALTYVESVSTLWSC